MRLAHYRMAILALLLALVASVGVQRAARASDAGAVLGGIIAGAIVYELLDDDDDYCHSRYYYSSPPRYRAPRYGYYYGPPVVEYRYYDYGRRGGSCGSYSYYDGPRTSTKAYRAPSHAQRNVAPPPGYGKGDRYRAPDRYRR
jgi:hypothetical protein